MDKFLFVTFLWLFFIEYSFAQSEHSVRECFVKNGNTEIIISHSNAIYSIAQYFDMIDKNSKYVPGPFASHRFIPENDSIPFYSTDEYHNDLFKLTRKILYSNYDSIISFVKDNGLHDGSDMYQESIDKACFFDRYSSYCFIQQNDFSSLSYDSLKMEKFMSRLSDFAKLIHYDDFFHENNSVYCDYITDRMPCIEDMRVWMNEMFDVNFKKIYFLTSPFSNPNSFELYENCDSLTITMIGGILAQDDMICSVMGKDSFIEDRVSRYNSGFYIFESMIMSYVGRIVQKNMILHYNYIRELLAMYLLYCHDMQSEMSFEKEKFVNIIYRFGPQFYKEEIEPLYDKLFLLRDKKEKNLLHIYIDMLENQSGH